MTEGYHVPVLLDESVEGLNIKPDGIYVDVTFGGGGHSSVIVKHLKGGHLYGFDQDQDAIKNAEKFDESSFTFIEGNFRFIKRYLRMHGVEKVDGILADLGVSSHQIDDPKRGFIFRETGPLDMRMDNGIETTAADILNNYKEDELIWIFKSYGEVENARKLASHICTERINRPFKNNTDLIQILDRMIPGNRRNKYFAKVFQALRIEVNQEIEVLESFLEQTVELLNPGGRLVVISYHSLEDRPVKNFINKGKITGEVEKDFYGNVLKPLDAVNRKVIVASDEELEINPRARSAKLRIAEKK